MGAAREAYDLFNSACRRHFWWQVKHMHGLRKAWFWKLVISDTWNRVCSRSKP